MKIKKNNLRTCIDAVSWRFSRVAYGVRGGNDVSSLFGKTLSFYGYANISEHNYIVENKTMKLDALVKNYFDKIDWNATLGKSKEEVKDSNNAMRIMSEQIYQNVDKKALKAVKFEFSSEEAAKVTVDGNEYAINSHTLYEYRFKTGKGEEEITIRYEGDNEFRYGTNVWNNSALPISETNTVFIKFLQPTEIADGQTGDICVSGRVLYKA